MTKAQKGPKDAQQLTGRNNAKLFCGLFNFQSRTICCTCVNCVITSWLGIDNTFHALKSLDCHWQNLVVI